MSTKHGGVPIEEQRAGDVLRRDYPSEETPLSGTQSQAEIVAYALDHPNEMVKDVADTLDYSDQWVASVLKRADNSFTDEYATGSKTLPDESHVGEWREQPTEDSILPPGYAELYVTTPRETRYVVPVEDLQRVAQMIVRRHSDENETDTETGT